jgi:tRNA threonylcarbamoyladenosine biosynthesis protein TsaB
MRVLGIESSSRRGSVALVERGQLVAARSHERPNAHAEELLPLVDCLMQQTNWGRESLNRVGVGIGPGSFTGLRVGIALAQGIALGLGVPLIGIDSLRCMARAVPATTPGYRCTFLDARRREVFCAVYSSDGAEIVPPHALARASAVARIRESLPPGPHLLVGEAAAELSSADLLRTAQTDLPHAQWAAVLAEEAPASHGFVEPLYVREPDAVRPDLPVLRPRG